MAIREFRAELPSTQTEAMRRAREGAASGTRVVAGEQTSGRGRLDHRWASPPGGLYLSLVVRAPAGDRTLLPLAIGTRLAALLADRYDVRVSVKWPNDLLVVGRGGVRKLGGVLVDEVDSPTLGRAAVVGVGLNVRTPTARFPPEVRDRVVTLAELVNPPPTLADVEEVVVDGVTSAAEALARPGGREALLDECRRALYGVGRTATVDGTLSGVITALGDEGELWLRTAEGPVAVRAGDVVVEDA